jgi:hypothetical protein
VARRRGDTPRDERVPYRVRVPGFAAGDTRGLGDVIKQVTRSFGIRPCGGCERRASALNRWTTFGGRSR